MVFLRLLAIVVAATFPPTCRCMRQTISASFSKANASSEIACEGRLLSKQGTCPDGLRCYNECPGQASLTVVTCTSLINRNRFDKGTCRLPKNSECSSSGKGGTCRPGTACKGGTCIMCETGLTQSVECVENAIEEAVARWRYRYTSSAYTPDVDATNAAYSAKGIQFVTRAKEHTINLIEMICTTGLKPIGKGASRSGASFFMTSDMQMIIKGFDRKIEYEEMVKFKKEFKVPKQGTTFVIPNLAFPAFDSTYWIIMPNANFVNEHVVGHVQKDKKKDFDVKPAPLISKDRIPFLQHLVKVQFKPPHDEHMEAFWSALESDLRYLDDGTLVDYSWFTNFYRMDDSFELPTEDRIVTVAEGGKPWCFSPGPDAHSNSILCMNLLDYSLNFASVGLIKEVESKVLEDKWKNYGNKFRTFTQCIFKMRPSEEELQSTLDLKSPPAAFVLTDRNTDDILERYKAHVVVDVKRLSPQQLEAVKHARGGLPPRKQHTKCYVYWKSACMDFFHGIRPFRAQNTCEVSLKVDLSVAGIDMEIDPKTKRIKLPATALNSHDDYWIQEDLKAKADYCLPYMAEVCQAWLLDDERQDIIAEHQANFIFLRP